MPFSTDDDLVSIHSSQAGDCWEWCSSSTNSDSEAEDDGENGAENGGQNGGRNGAGCGESFGDGDADGDEDDDESTDPSSLDPAEAKQLDSVQDFLAGTCSGDCPIDMEEGIWAIQLGLAPLKNPRLSTVKTAIGPWSLDLDAHYPPRVVVLDGAEEEEEGEEEIVNLGSLPSSPSTPPPSPTSARSASFSSSPSSPSSVSTFSSSSSSSSSSSTPSTSSTTTPAATDSTMLVNNCFVVRPSPIGGLGAFAHRPIARGEHILVEKPLLQTDSFHLSETLDSLTPDKRAAFYSLHGHHPNSWASQAERIWTANTFATTVRIPRRIVRMMPIPPGRSSRGDEGTRLSKTVIHTETVQVLEAVFELASRFNHACPPLNNVLYRYDGKSEVLVMTAKRAIAAGSELFISYGKTPEMLYKRFGFRCSCGACAGYKGEPTKSNPWGDV